MNRGYVLFYGETTSLHSCLTSRCGRSFLRKGFRQYNHKQLPPIFHIEHWVLLLPINAQFLPVYLFYCINRFYFRFIYIALSNDLPHIT